VLASGAIRNFTLVGSPIGPGGCTIPATAKALSVNITMQAATGQGSASLAPACPFGAGLRPGPFQVGSDAGEQCGPGAGSRRRDHGAVPGVGSGPVHLLIDVNGYFE
jgi:hypothetical protein